MKVKLQHHEKYPSGFKAYWDYNPVALEIFKRCAGFQWDQSKKVWYSEGPEVLLDMARFGIEVQDLTPYARMVAEAFRDNLTELTRIRSLPWGDERFGYQESGIEWLKNQRTAILADDKGTGKTRQTIVAAQRTDPRKVLVVPLATTNYNWVDEVNMWWPGASVGVLPEGSGPRANFWAKMPQVTIANYEKLLVKDWPIDEPWDVVIFDEASNKLKNSTNKTYKIASKIIKNAKQAWLVTANPLEMSLDDLYSLFCLIRPAVLGGYGRFHDQHVEKDWVGDVVGIKNLELLRERIGPWMLRRTKAEVLPYLPPKIYTNFRIKMTPAEEKAYKALLKEFDGDLVKTVRMRQFCATPEILEPGFGRGSKYEALIETLKNHKGRSVVFCYYKEALKLIRDWMTQDHYDPFKHALHRILGTDEIDYHPEAYISGDVPTKKRNEVIKAFNAGQLGSVLLCTDAANMGVNITGANQVVHYDQLWNPQLMGQREDRTHRIGQEAESVQIVNLLNIGTIDVGMYDVCREREQLYDDVIEGSEEMMIKKLSPERLKNLVRGRPL